MPVTGSTSDTYEIVSRPCTEQTSIFSDEKLLDSSAMVTDIFKLVLPAEHRPSPLKFRKGTPKLYIHRYRVGSSSAHPGHVGGRSTISTMAVGQTQNSLELDWPEPYLP